MKASGILHFMLAAVGTVPVSEVEKRDPDRKEVRRTLNELFRKARLGQRVVRIYGCCLLMCTSLAACSDGRTIDWKQEVKLHDGGVIALDRISKQTGKTFPESTILEYEQSIAFTIPDTNEHVSWILPKGVGAVLLDFNDGVPYFVGRAMSVSDYNSWKCPNPLALVFRYVNQQWNRITVDELPSRFVTPNLILSAASVPVAKSSTVLTVHDVDKFFGDPRMSTSFRIIPREKVNPIAQGCFESVLIQQGRQSEIDTRR